MKYNFYAGMIASFIGVASFCSCSSEESFEALQETPAVQFQTDIASMTRSVTTLSNLKDFTVSAYLKQGDLKSVFMDKVKVSNEAGKWTPAGTYVWPYTGTLSFFSFSPSNLSVDMPAASAIDNTAPSFSYTAPSNSYQQSDVLYAVNANHQYTGSDASSVVNVNFRHALSQIVFSAKCENPNWQIDIADVQIFNVKSTGKYSFPTATTKKPGTDATDVRGSWTLGSDLNSYNTGFDPVTGITGNVVSLTTSENFPLLLLPQTLKAWDPVNDSKCEQKGAYFMIRCKLKQKTAEGDYAILWPAAGQNAYGYVAVPVSADWKEGKKYNYVFNFKDGAGYIPPTETGGGEDIVPGKEVLAKISFDVLVDDFTTSTTTQVNM